MKAIIAAEVFGMELLYANCMLTSQESCISCLCLLINMACFPRSCSVVWPQYMTHNVANGGDYEYRAEEVRRPVNPYKLIYQGPHLLPPSMMPADALYDTDKGAEVLVSCEKGALGTRGATLTEKGALATRRRALMQIEGYG